MSAHADADELVRWASPLAASETQPAPRKTFVVHGEENASEALARRLERELGFHCEVPHHGQSFDLNE